MEESREMTLEEKLARIVTEIEMNSAQISQNATLLSALAQCLVTHNVVTEMQVREHVEYIRQQMQSVEAHMTSSSMSGEDVEKMVNDIEVG